MRQHARCVLQGHFQGLLQAFVLLALLDIIVQLEVNQNRSSRVLQERFPPEMLLRVQIAPRAPFLMSVEHRCVHSA